MNSSRGKILIRVLLVAGASIIPFLPGLDSPFLFDDLNTLVRNPSIRLVETLRFFTDPTAFSVKPGNWPYRPVLLVVNSLQYMVCGLDPVFPWRLFSILVHFINSVLVMAMADKVFRLKRGALFAGLLFAAAPIQTQAVIYLSARSMVIACAPALAAIVAIITLNRDESKSTKVTLLWTALALAGAALAFFSSEGALALVVWMPIAFFVSGAKPAGKRVWIALIAIGALAALFLLARAVLSPGPGLGGYTMIKPSHSTLDHVQLQLRTPFLMARLFVLPVHLSILRYAPASSSVFANGILAAIGLVAVLAAMVLLRRHRAPVAGLAWYVASLLPAVFVPLNVAWAEHRAYLALPGLAIAAAWCIEALGSLQKKEGRYLSLAITRALFIVIIACLGLLSTLRARQWESPRSIFRDAARKAPGYEVPWNFLAAGAHGRGDYETALSYLDLALAINPNFADAHNTRADCMVKLERPEEAYKSARRAVELDPANPNYWNSLAVVLMMDEKWDDAETALKNALERLLPNDPGRTRIERHWMMIKEHKRAAPENNQ